ncbi:TNF receptor-associated factor 1 isoform 1-T4 [Hipposideros larvatus]|uniref:TNF receptor-associated factor n=1 Tax=Hipposideros armiger TaxID=186990 RepID=A0A8B7RRU9_HIPAR|nr:PREDICTED: TNF receptor-associated factor 1 [Hipposideros armiger]XP_019503815.1 PREDICTED: TNF receptor-associated factor 1 [Hipposideros armiger]XP_019503816.1 PREDICTED: TNF receptor-associated factor 1 [Hipposideros armiger]XP_019503817.1 PREDICTED: TNF receptor-associated factor 1 [Hipposideros armiger]XP_019503818.1 PREDICTED: TNF receptor-associated factor 1 [Hipposideros armiger]XP_019503819.1 PREDICTED: TNF receptor-associated factor 1 [Hipposideros armiger]XP_019503820.1 PREDICTE
MASGSASSPRPAPDENEFPFGCPPTVCQDPSEPRALCCTACLSENVRNGEDRICPTCRGHDLQSVSPGSLVSQEKDHPEVAVDGVECPFAGVGCSFKGSPKLMQEHEITSQATHLNLLLEFMKHWKAQLGSGLVSRPIALEQNMSDLQLQGAVEVAGDLEVDCYRAPCSESQEELALQHFMKEKLLADLEGKLRVFENIVAVLNKEVEASHLALAASIHQSQLDREHILRLEQRVVELQQTLAQKDQALGKLEQNLRLMEEASFDGTFLWKITNVTRRCHESACGRTVSLFSPAFYTSKYGYKLCLRLYLNGDGAGKKTHLSLFIVIMKGEYDALLPWPFRNKVTFMLLDQNNREHAIDAFRPDLSSASFQRPHSETNVASGCPLFFPLSRLQSPKHAYVKDDTMFLKCIVETSA